MTRSMSSGIEDFKNKIANHRGLARPNRYEVRLPRLSHIPGFETDIEGLNLMCSNVNLPGKQILTADREIGIKFEKVPYGYAVDDTSLTFYLTNDYQAKRYFEAWAGSTVNYNKHQLQYKNVFQKTVEIFQVADGLDLDITEVSADLQGGGRERIYGCRLFEAFPTTLNPVEMSYEANNVVAVYNCQLSYTDWEEIPLETTITTEPFTSLPPNLQTP